MPPRIVTPLRRRQEALEAKLQEATALHLSLNEKVTSLEGQLTEARTSLVRPGFGSSGKAARNPFGKVHAGQTLYECYKAVPWISSPIDVIAKRMTSGGFELEPAYKGANIQHKQDILDLLLYVNDDEDLIENITVSICDLFIFAESYWEQVLAAKRPTELYYIDPVGMEPLADERGTITGYQQETGVGKPIPFTKDQVIYFRLRGPRGKTLSPIEKLLNSTVCYNHMASWWSNWFENGAKPPFAIDLGEKAPMESVAPASALFEEMFAGAANAHKTLILAAGASVVPMGDHSPVEFDFLASARFLRDQMLSVLGVPPAQIGVIETANLGGGTGVAQDKGFRNNTISPVRRLVEEKLTYRLIQKGFGYDDWVFRLREASYDDDQLLVNLVIAKVQGGLISRNEGREQLAENGPIDGGDVATVQLANELVPLPDLDYVHGTQYQHMQQLAMAGVDPNAKPEDLIGKMPPGLLPKLPNPGGVTQDTTLAVSKNRAQAAAAEEPQTGKPSEALVDLARWQRKALKAFKDGQAQPAFESTAIDAATMCAVAATLTAVTSTEDIREVFDLAFTDMREEQ